MTDLDLAEVERLLEAATPGPWAWYSEDASMAMLCRQSDGAFGVDLEAHILSVTVCKNCQQDHKHWDWGRCYTAKAPDAALIAAAPGIIRSLLSALKAERERTGKMEAALERLIADYSDVPDATDTEAQQAFADARAALGGGRT